MTTLALTGVATLGLCLLFAGCYLLARRMDNYGIVDIAWSYAFGGLAAFYALAAEGWPLRRALLLGMVSLWSLRLGTHLFRRVMGHHPVEDGRYQTMRTSWRENFASKMAGFFQLQALSVVVLGLPFLLAMRNPAPQLHALEIVGAVLWLIALVGEAVADAQLAAFKRGPANRGAVCDRGLWRLSRHPNYFFEWLVWVAFALFACASPFGCLSFLSPAVMLLLLLRVTGIPATEEQAVRSKGEAYRQYQRTTSVFIPWWPKHCPASHARHTP